MVVQFKTKKWSNDVQNNERNLKSIASDVHRATSSYLCPNTATIASWHNVNDIAYVKYENWVSDGVCVEPHGGI